MFGISTPISTLKISLAESFQTDSPKPEHNF
jgi:hypothetical protein